MNLRITTLALLAALALLGAGCGQDSQKGKPIPSAQVTELNKQLDAVQRRFEHGDGACDDIKNVSEPAIQSLVDQIPSSVDRKVRDSLRQSVDRLFQLTASQCDATPTNTDTTPTETNTTPTDTTPPETNTTPTDTNTTPTDTTPTTPDNAPPGQQKQKKPKKQDGNADGNGNGGGPAAPGVGG
jgi:hypothetical protein